MFDLLATTAFGLESVVRFELKELGIEASITNPGRIRFQGDGSTVCRANLWLRTADRVLILLQEFPAEDFDALFDTIKAFAWEDWIPQDGNIHVVGRSHKSQLTSVPAVQRATKRAIVDRLQSKFGSATLPETGATYKIEIALLNNMATLTLDTTGPSLHKRGYRELSGPAPLKETLAAAMVQLSLWNPQRPLIDPFCGTGTIPIEAAFIARNRAPGLERKFIAEDWPFIDAADWIAERESAREAVRDSIPERIIGTDMDGGALKMARYHAEKAGVSDDVHFQRIPFDEITSKREYGCVITNPPYGLRLGEPDLAAEVHRAIPRVLSKLPTWSHFILTAFPDFEKTINKEATRRRKLYNGRIECTYFQFYGPKPPQGSSPAKNVPVENSSVPAASSSLPVVDSGAPENACADASQAAVEPTTSELNTGQIADTTLVQDALAAGHLPETVPTVSTNESSSSDVKSDAHKTSEPPQASEPLQANDPPQVNEPPQANESQEHQEKPKLREPPKPVFGGANSKASEQAELFRARLKKRARHFRRWPTKKDIHCFRLYERDIPEIPLVVDRYEDHLHITEYERPHDRDLAQHADWMDVMADAAAESLDVDREKVFVKDRQRQTGKTQHEKANERRYEIAVREGGLKFWVNLSDYIDTGLFLDHRITRAMFRDSAKDARVLNLFGYTGAFTVYAADGGAAEVTTVDLSSTYLDWARRNLAANGFEGEQFHFERRDAQAYLDDLAAETKFDLVIVDPPTFSNTKRYEEDWVVQRDHARLLNSVLDHLSDEGTIYFSTNFRRFKLDEPNLNTNSIHEISRQTVPEDFRNRRIHRCWILRAKQAVAENVTAKTSPAE